MKLTILFYIQGIAATIASLVWIFAPGAFLSSGGLATTDPGWLLFGQNTGALLLAWGVIALVAARAAESPLRRNLGIAFFALQAASLVIHGLVWLTKGVTFGGGSALILHTLFSLLFGYLVFSGQGQNAAGPKTEA